MSCTSTDKSDDYTKFFWIDATGATGKIIATLKREDLSPSNVINPGIIFASVDRQALIICTTYGDSLGQNYGNQLTAQVNDNGSISRVAYVFGQAIYMKEKPRTARMSDFMLTLAGGKIVCYRLLGIPIKPPVVNISQNSTGISVGASQLSGEPVQLQRSGDLVNRDTLSGVDSPEEQLNWSLPKGDAKFNAYRLSTGH